MRLDQDSFFRIFILQCLFLSHEVRHTNYRGYLLQSGLASWPV